MGRPDLEARLRRIRLLALDVDGVLNDGQIYLSSIDEIKPFFSRDGIGLKCLHLSGLKSAIITARSSPAVTRRARELSISEVVLNAEHKGEALKGLCQRLSLSLEEAAFLGDDLQDLSALMIAGVAFSVADCPPEVRARVDVVTRARGGRGAVREAVETLLKAQGRWDEIVARFLA